MAANRPYVRPRRPRGTSVGPLGVREQTTLGRGQSQRSEHEVRVRYSPQRVIECGPMWAPKTWTEIENLISVLAERRFVNETLTIFKLQRH